MKNSKKLALAGVLTLSFASASLADDGQIVRVTPGAISAVARQFALTVDKELGQGTGVYLVHGPKIPGVAHLLKSHPLVVSVQSNSAVALPEVLQATTKFNLQPDPKNVGKVGVPLSQVAGTPTVALAGLSGTLLPSRYLYMLQPGVQKINLPLDLKTGLPLSYGTGVRVAIIDTWIDASNTTLAGSIDTSKNRGAYDCITDQVGGASVSQETSPFIDQETSPFIDGTGAIMVNQETSPFIDQETSPFIDQETSPFIDGGAFGHGTMVAGLVHRIAPGATLIPIRAFQNDGSGSMADIIQGIYYAVDTAKVSVINMSFSAPADSPELQAAIQYAISKGVICVASVSNSNSGANVYPAAETSVIGVAATDYADFKAQFSDYGADVDLAAPGVYITSTFPRDSAGRDHWAMASGTSFATPMVAGTVAVMKSVNWSGITATGAAQYLNQAADPIQDPVYRLLLGNGRLDVSGSAQAASKH